MIGQNVKRLYGHEWAVNRQHDDQVGRGRAKTGHEAVDRRTLVDPVGEYGEGEHLVSLADGKAVLAGGFERPPTAFGEGVAVDDCMDLG
jgi:hypothetical protein